MLAHRQNAESAIAAQMKAAGVEAEASLAFVPPGGDFRYDDIKALLSDNGVEAILILSHKDTRRLTNGKRENTESEPIVVGALKTAEYAPKNLEFTPVARRGGGSGGAPAARDGNFLVTLEANLKELGSERSVWTGELTFKADYSTIDGLTDSVDEIEQISRLLIAALLKDGMIGKSSGN